MKELEKVLSEQILQMKANNIAVCETELHPIYLDRTEKDNAKWLGMITAALKTAQKFEIHCWNEEQEWIDLALQYGEIEESDWKYGKIISGNVTPEFADMLLGMSKPQDTEIYNKMTPFFNVFLDDSFQSSHYGTEVYVVQEMSNKEA